MHIAGKIFLGLGAVMFVIGGIMTITGGDTLSDVEWDVEGKSVFEGPDGTYIHSADDIMIIYVRDSVDCESFELTFTNETGAQGYDADTMDDSDGDGDPANDNDYPFFTKEECADDGMSVSSGDDPSGYYSIGELSNMEKGEYEVSSTYSFYTVPFFETLVEAGGEVVGGLLSIAGGIGIAVCGLCSLLLGGVLALALNDNKPQTVVVNPPQQ
tara:strand:- start:18034 stop:18672 length:639 start_codon:yes stop_codon:yes gene_type:complete